MRDWIAISRLSERLKQLPNVYLRREYKSYTADLIRGHHFMSFLQ